MSDYIKPSEYQNLPSGVSVVYSIVDIDDITNLYAGSCKCIRRRIANHISDCYNENCKEYNFKLYQYLRANGGIHHFKFKILEYVEDIDTLFNREQYYYDLHRPPLNMIRPRAIPRAEYDRQRYEQNKEKLNEQHKQYYQQNKEAIAEYYQQNKEAIAEQKKQHYQQNKEQIIEKVKQYREQNKEKLNEQKKQYYQTNKERLQQKHNCLICSGKYTTASKNQHFKSKKHQRALQKNSQSQSSNFK